MGGTASRGSRALLHSIFPQQIQRPFHGGNGLVDVRLRVRGSRHAAEAGQIDAVQQHGATKRVQEIAVFRTVELVEIAAVRNEIIAARPGSFVVRHQRQPENSP